MKTSVPVGITSVIGWATMVLGCLPIIVQSVAEGAVAFQGPEKYLAILGIVVGAITQLGRYIQAHAAIKAAKPAK